MSDDIKQILFTLLKSERFAEMARWGRYDTIAKEAVPAVMERVKGYAARDTLSETLATGILHYILTASRTPSHRKAEYEGVTLDIVIPNIRTMSQHPGRALVIQIGCDCDVLAARLHQTMQVQPARHNIWCLTQDCQHAHTYTISGQGATFPKMVADMMRFAAEHGHDRLGMVP